MAFIDDMRAAGHAVETTGRVLTEQGCQVAHPNRDFTNGVFDDPGSPKPMGYHHLRHREHPIRPRAHHAFRQGRGVNGTALSRDRAATWRSACSVKKPTPRLALPSANFPQPLTHATLVQAALALSRTRARTA